MSRSRPFVIDFHAHMVTPEAQSFSTGHVIASKPGNDPPATPEGDAYRKWQQESRRKMFDMPTRLRIMDETGVDLQVLTPSLIHQYTYWADEESALRIEQLTNDNVAELVSKVPGRFVGLGSVPLSHPAAATRELQRCMRELGLRGVEISSHAHTMELGDPQLRPFWEAAQQLDAVIYLHPTAVTDPRYEKWQLWNSIGQPLEEAMAMSSLWYEGVLDAYPRLKLCIAHGGGYLPYYAGRADRNYEEKPYTRINMSKSPSDYMREHFWYDSCVYNVDMLEFLARKVGVSRVVMGSDYPVGEADPVGFVMKARGLTSEDQADILGRNAAKLLGLAL